MIQPSQHNPPLEDIGNALSNSLPRNGTAPMTAPFKLADGLVGSPSLAFATAPSTGLFKTTNGYAVTINGTQVAEFGSGGLLSGVVTASIADQAVTLQKLVQPGAPSILMGSNANPALTITGAANNGSGLIRLTVADTSTFATGQGKVVAGVVGTTEANGGWVITVVDATHIDLQGSTFVNAYVSGGTIGGSWDRITLGAGLSMAGSVLSASNNPGLIPGFISGLTLSTAGSSATFGISAGVANDSAARGMMVLPSVYTKTTSAWALGSGVGALDTGTIAINTWYHVFVIERTDTSVVDVLISLSPTTPTMPTSYTFSRRIGAMKTNGSAQWAKFVQLGDEFVLDVPVQDLSLALGGSTLYTLASVPPGVSVKANFISYFQSTVATAEYIISSGLTSAQTPAVPGTNYDAVIQSTNQAVVSRLSILTNTTAQIRAASNGVGVITWGVVTHGWTDARGK